MTNNDAVSREAVISIILHKWARLSDANDAIQESVDRIREMPSIVEPIGYVRNIHDKEICPYCGKERWSKE